MLRHRAVATGLSSNRLRILDALYEGESGAVEYPPAESRLRYFGGTTNHGGGWCRPLLPIDFEGRSVSGIPAWPLSRVALEPYCRRAQPLCQLSAFDFDDPEPWQARTGLSPLSLPGDDWVTRFFIYSPPTRFGVVYRDDVVKAANIKTYLNSNVVEILPNAEASRIERLKIAALDGNGFEIRPRLCILAAGGIENARLLLASNSVQAVGLGNGNDLVGRYFMEHVTAPSDALAIRMADRNAAAKLGEVWAKQENRRPETVLGSLQKRLPGGDAGKLRDAIAEDFRNGAVVKIEGRQIARTQAELCALAYFATVGSL
jgi:choline dehydrogenase-like flavoprotein